MNPLWKMPEVFILIILQVIRIHFSKWEVVVVVCRPRTAGGMRIFELIMIQKHFGEWESHGSTYYLLLSSIGIT